MENKQSRSLLRKEQRNRVKRWKAELDDEEINRLAKESDEVTAGRLSCASSSTSESVEHHVGCLSSPVFEERQARCQDNSDEQDDSRLVDTNTAGGTDNSDRATIKCAVSDHDNFKVDDSRDESHSCSNLSDSSFSGDDQPSEAESLVPFDCDLDELACLLDEIEEAEARPDSELMKKLAVWTVEKNVVHRHVDGLLKILKTEGHPDLPTTCKTLLKTPKKIKDHLKPLGAGTFWYQGIQRGLQQYLCEEHLEDDTATIDVFVDGASPYKSVKVSLWPVVGHIVGSDPPCLFIIALWCGSTKDPVDLDGFLQEFVVEAKTMMEEGFLWNGRKLQFKIRRYVADAPARAFLKNVLAHNAYGSCERCSSYGQWKGRVVFPAQAAAELRTDLSFSSRLHAAYHKGDSPLEMLGTGMISQFPLDGMHLLYLGVMRKLLKELLNEKKPGSHKLTDTKKEELSAYLISFSPHCVSEFSRKPRTLNDWRLFKAHELRRILLYDGILLYSELPETVKNNFLLFHCSVRILSDKTKRQYIHDADYLLKTFVKHSSSRNMYGPTCLVYNVHHLEHFAADCEEHGTVEEFSAFLNENFIGHLKDMLNTPGRTLTQIVARVLEQAQHLEPSLLKPPALELHGPHFSGALFLI